MNLATNSATETRKLTPLSSQREAGRSYLLVLEGGSSSLFPLPAAGVVLIGRGSETQLRLQDASVSRRHAKIILTEGQVALADLTSSNGTSIHGERISGTVPLRSGDVFAVGDVILVFHGEPGSRVSRRVFVDLEQLTQRIEDEIERSLRYERSLALLAISSSGTAGERAVISRVISAHVRPLDVASLCGDAHILLLLPEAGADAASAMALRLAGALSAVASRVKVGFATCPDDGCDADTLISAARAAVSTAQAQGVAAATQSVTRLTLEDRSIIIADPAMTRLFELIRRLAPSEMPVLISGETGVGKENAAFAVHHFSARKGRPFVAINCAAIQESLVENELFGHERGAFSGAVSAKVGLIESSSGGTIFLDEVGELSAPVQAKLLRVLEAKRITRLGDVREREVDIRIVAATNRDLEKEVREGRFRQDLFFRLSAANVILPPLRERPREIPILSRTFLDRACDKAQRPTMLLSAAILHRLSTYPWPGNVRELRNVMDFLAAAVPEDTAEPWHLPERLTGLVHDPVESIDREAPQAPRSTDREAPQAPRSTDREAPQAPRSIDREAPQAPRSTDREAPQAPAEQRSARSFRPLSEEIRELERARMVEALKAAHGKRKRAAELLSMPLRTFVMKVKQHGIG